MKSYVNTHAQLEARRDKALQALQAGRTNVTGPRVSFASNDRLRQVRSESISTQMSPVHDMHADSSVRFGATILTRERRKGQGRLISKHAFWNLSKQF